MSESHPTRLPTPIPTTARLSLHRNDQANPSPSLSTAEHLRFQLDHALARDAVHTPLDLRSLLDGLSARGLQPLPLHSAAPNRTTYLRRPDLGRTLSPESVTTLQQHIPTTIPTLALILADGLSALALEHHALPLLDALLPLIPYPLSLVPVIQQARVAIADGIGHLLHAPLTLLLIGERPGLSSPDSLGCYITWDPRPGRTDAERNCISNIRGPEGLSYAEAALRIAHYLREAHRLQTTGTALKDPTGVPASNTLSSAAHPETYTL